MPRTVRYNAGMNIQQNVSLKDHSTMRLGGTAAYMAEIHDRYELAEAIAWAEQQSIPVMMIGDGSNIVWRDEGYPGLLLVNKILRFEEQQEDDENYYVTVGAGENWDSVVARTVAKGMTGIEALSLIPGTTGATPVQNVGAYGQDISQTLVTAEVYDRQAKQTINLQNFECAFGYRTSRFKTADKGRFFITAVTLHLLHKNPGPPFYGAVQQYFDEHSIKDYTPAAVREAVISIRSSKLPDPAQVANNGSFFANPVIEEWQFRELSDTYNTIPHWPVDDNHVKIPAAWLLEQAGFKDIHDTETGMGTWPAQPLVLVNEHAVSSAQLAAFRDKIIKTVQEKFGITLMQEPELLP